LDQPIHLSVVATSRNDNHGGSLTHRMQHFVDGFVAQCKRHGLRAELILVEWNPPADRVPLRDELRWPADPGPCDIRIVTVPCELHAELDHGGKIPLFQMLAKNVGIRRARGRFVLATNIDILFSDAAITFMRDRLRPGCLYRAERVDVPTEVPQGADFGAALEFCEREGFRIHAPADTISRKGAAWTVVERWRARLDPRLVYLGRLAKMALAPIWLLGLAVASPQQAKAKVARYIRNVSPVEEGALAASGSASVAGGGMAGHSRSAMTRIARYVRERVTGIPRRLVLPWRFTNACGDFTLLSREDWERLGGYPEWPVFSWHLDSILLYQAEGLGLREENFGPGAPIYHIEHGKGSGYTPEGAETLFNSLKARGIPFLSDAELRQVHFRIRDAARAGQGPLFNETSWGMALASLVDETVAAPEKTT
jgi:hypothetical protein